MERGPLEKMIDLITLNFCVKELILAGVPFEDDRISELFSQYWGDLQDLVSLGKLEFCLEDEVRFHLTCSENISEFLQRSNEYLKSMDLKWEMALYSKDSIPQIENPIIAYQMGSEDEFEYLWATYQSSDPPTETITLLPIIELFSIFEEFISKLKKEDLFNQSNLLLEKAFYHLPYPLCILTTEGEVIRYGKYFSQLQILPREASKLLHGSEYEKSGKLYKVYRTELSDKLVMLVFFPFSLDRNISFNFEDLGIISSSIAHELNNPLAGILTAISCLEFEQFSSDSSEVLLDMKKSGKRCKELVEIFLGFSRTHLGHQSPCAARDLVCHAYDLLRFRMMENGVHMDLIVKQGGAAFQHQQFNSSLITMVFYLLFGDIFTLVAHKRLLAETSYRKNIQFEERSNSLTLQFDLGFDFAKFYQEPKLLTHLLELESIKVKYGASFVTLSF